MASEHTAKPNSMTAHPQPPAPPTPKVATAPVLVLVGAMMMGETDQIDWRNMLVAVPAFLTIVVQPFTFSIANGIYAGLVMSALVYILTGSFVEVGRDMVAQLRGGGSRGIDDGIAAGEGCSDSGDLDDLDATEAAGGGGLGAGGLGAARKDEAGGLAERLLPGGGSRGESQGGGSAHDLSSLAAPSSAAISITHRRGSRDGGAAGSLSRSHPYERGSFSMLILTHGSQHAAGPMAGHGSQSLGLYGSPAHQSPTVAGAHALRGPPAEEP